MRAREFIREFTINVPVTINIPLSDLLKAEQPQVIHQIGSNTSSNREVVNPGVRYDDDGDAKWSPPLQQHLDTVKDSVGPTEDDVTIEPDKDEDKEIEKDDEIEKSLTGIIDIKPDLLG